MGECMSVCEYVSVVLEAGGHDEEDVLSRPFQTSCQMMQLDPAFDDDNGDDDEREAMVMGARRSFHPRITAVRFFSLLRNSRRGPTVALRRIPKNN